MSFEEYAANLAKKQRATEDDLAMYAQIEGGRGSIAVGDDTFILDPEGEDDELDMAEREASDADNPYWDISANAPEGVAQLANSVDHRPYETAIKNQDGRGTCVCFASLANLEAILKRHEKGDCDLSEQYANWLYMRIAGKNQCDDGLRTTLAARHLSSYGVCEESLAPYEVREVVQEHCLASPSKEVIAGAKYGIATYTLIDRLGLQGPSIANPSYLERLLAEDHDITFGTKVAWGHPDDNGVHDVILDPYGNPLPSRGGHAMLVVGYERAPDTPIPYIVCKNSWGPDKGVDGYYYLSYDYIRTYAKYGYIVTEMRTDMSGTP